MIIAMNTLSVLVLVIVIETATAQFYLPLRVKSEKIIDGQITDISRTPYQLRLSLLRLPICGATLVSSNIAFTAAHCVGLRAIPFLYSVQAGANTMSDPRGQKIRVRRIVVNPNYPGRTGVSDDFCILFLWRDVIFSDRVRPARIASRMYPAGTDAVISGWGTTEDGVASIMLRAAPVKLISNQECSTGFRPLNVSGLVDASMICTTAERRGTCYGDSGGPLVVNNEIVGVTSWGAVRCLDIFPSVYSNVFYQLPFIRAQAPELFAQKR